MGKEFDEMKAYIDGMIIRSRDALKNPMTPSDVKIKAKKLVHRFDVSNPYSCYNRFFRKELEALEKLMDHPEQMELF